MTTDPQEPEMTFDEHDVTGLQAKLEGLELTDGEHAALVELVSRARGDSSEVTGYAVSRRPIGDLTGFLPDRSTRLQSDPLVDITPFLSSGHTTGGGIIEKPGRG